MTVSAPVKLQIQSIPHTHKKNKNTEKYVLDTDTTRPRGRDETKDPRVRIEPLRDVLPILDLRRAIQSEIEIPMKVEKYLENIQHPRHLREDQYPVTPRLSLPQQSTELLEFATVILQQRRVRKRNLKLDARTVQDVVERGRTGLDRRLAPSKCQAGKIQRNNRRGGKRELVNNARHFLHAFLVRFHHGVHGGHRAQVRGLEIDGG